MFFVPETDCGASDRVKKVIADHGGICVEQNECTVIQIKPNVNLDYTAFYPGEIFNEAWVYDCISQKQKIDIKSFHLG